LIDRQIKEYWDRIEAEPPDDEPLTNEERKQLREGDEYISWEEAKNEFGL
jgi:hypothetical protein